MPPSDLEPGGPLLGAVSAVVYRFWRPIRRQNHSKMGCTASRVNRSGGSGPQGDDGIYRKNGPVLEDVILQPFFFSSRNPLFWCLPYYYQPSCFSRSYSVRASLCANLTEHLPLLRIDISLIFTRTTIIFWRCRPPHRHPIPRIIGAIFSSFPPWQSPT